MASGLVPSSTIPRSAPKAVATTFLLVSDTHNLTPAKSREENALFRLPFPTANVFVHAGDMTNQGSLSELKRVIEWVEEVPAELKILIAGNHDWRLDEDYWATQYEDSSSSSGSETNSSSENPNREESDRCRSFLLSRELRDKGIYYLEDEVRTFELLNGARFTVLASPYTPRGKYPHDGGSFRYDRRSGKDSRKFWEHKFPKEKLKLQAGVDSKSRGIDVVITHGPAYNMLDETSHGEKVGCSQLWQFIEKVKPIMSVCGHVHEAAGARLVTWEGTDSDGEKKRIENDLRPAINRAEEMNGSLYSDIKSRTREVVKGEQTVFVNASIGRSGVDNTAMSCPVLVELKLPYKEVEVYEGLGMRKEGHIAAEW
ncbi:hypothetical protein ABW19_dt0200102 [Dactylella cylindrospora]|nr:hypothetical protein ABW19_dt0200102 [Dactylella cylindrospora]